MTAAALLATHTRKLRRRTVSLKPASAGLESKTDPADVTRAVTPCPE